jgi:hypothetical protein
MPTPRISVVCVTNRPNAVPYLLTQLEKQTFKDFEVIVADDLCTTPLLPGHFKPRGKGEGDVWNLNKAYNDALDRVTGELVVFLQDFIWIPANGLERFVETHELYPTDLITGVGHKAKDGLNGISETDERVFGDPGLSPGNETHFELNWASCPTSQLQRFDEEMDKHYGGENQVFASKAMKAGSRVWIDRSNRCIGFSQDECGGRPGDWEEHHWNKTNMKELWT